MTQAPRAGSESVENATRTAAAGGQGRGRLLLLTDFYPYEVGEEFLEQEIETLCAAFDEVVIVPVRLSEGAR
ncbi:MAG: glycosyl transferase, partial [Actinomyces bowdenii]|nr:glycosyl transferase [Actinomyces bowdenii]